MGGRAGILMVTDMPFCTADTPSSLGLGSRYCSASCQRAAWSIHKQSCSPPAVAPPPDATIPAILLGKGIKADKVLIQQPPWPITSVRHLFTQHRRSHDSDFITMSMPLFKRLFQRDIHIMFDRTFLPGNSAGSTGADDNTWATRSAAALSTGLGPPIRGQALMFDPTGAPFQMGDFMSYDNIVYNQIMGKYSGDWAGRAPTDAQLDEFGEDCRQAYIWDRPQYTDEGQNIAYEAAMREAMEDEGQETEIVT